MRGWVYAGVLACVPWCGVQAQVIYDFGSSPGDGLSPSGPVTLAPDGTLYGVTSVGGANGLGTVYAIAPFQPGHGARVETTLWSFGSTSSDQFVPMGKLTMGPGGMLYGVGETIDYNTYHNEEYVFQMTPPMAGGTLWTEQTLATFAAFTSPNAIYSPGLVLDPSGNLYGSVVQGGANADGLVFELSPPAMQGGAWTETDLFTGSYANAQNEYLPNGDLVIDAHGNLYGTDLSGGGYEDGDIFELSPPTAGQGGWTKTLLHVFNDNADHFGKAPDDGVTMGPDGTLYGTTTQGGTYHNFGTIYALLAPTAQFPTWRISALHDFEGNLENGYQGTPIDGAQPVGTLALDPHGNIYGATYTGGYNIGGYCDTGCGSFYELKRPAELRGPWAETLLPQTSVSTGTRPPAGVILDGHGSLYGTAADGGPNQRSVGTVFRMDAATFGQ